MMTLEAFGPHFIDIKSLRIPRMKGSARFAVLQKKESKKASKGRSVLRDAKVLVISRPCHGDCEMCKRFVVQKLPSSHNPGCNDGFRVYQHTNDQTSLVRTTIVYNS